MNLSQWFGRIYVGNDHAVYMANLDHDAINKDVQEGDRLAYLVAEAAKRDSGVDEVVGQLVKEFPNMRVRYGNDIYPKNVLLDVFDSILDRPFVPGAGVGGHQWLGLHQAVSHYVRGLSVVERSRLGRLSDGRVNTVTGEFDMEVREVISLLRVLDAESLAGCVVLELQASHSTLKADELLSLFGQNAQKWNETHTVTGGGGFVLGIHEVVMPMLSLDELENGHLLARFGMKASPLEAVAKGVTPDMERLLSLSFATGDTYASMLADVCPSWVESVTMGKGEVQWVEKHEVTYEQVKQWTNVPASSPSHMVLAGRE